MARARRRRRKTKTRSATRIVRRAPAGKAAATRQPAARTTHRRASAGGAPAPRQPAAHATRRPRIALPPPSRAETLLLTLAKDVADVPLDVALRRITDAFTLGAELPREVFNAWIKTRREKTASLALSWAREQVRLSLEETIARSPTACAPCSSSAVTPRRAPERLEQQRRRAGEQGEAVELKGRPVREREGAVVARAPRRLGARQDHDRGPQQEAEHRAAEPDARERAAVRPSPRHGRD